MFHQQQSFPATALAFSHLNVSEAARRIGARPRDISDAFYARLLDEDRCPIVSNRRAIPVDYLGEIRRVLEKAGRPIRPLTAA